MRALLGVVGWALLASSAGAAPAGDSPKVPASPASPAAASAPIRLALAPLGPIKGMGRRGQLQLADRAEVALQQQGLEVFGPAALSASLNSKRLRPCEQPDCLLGLAQAVEAEFVAHLSVAPARKPSQLTLKVLDGEDGTEVAALSSPVPDARSATLEKALAQLAPRANSAMQERRAAKAEPQPPPPPPPSAPVRVVEAFADGKPPMVASVPAQPSAPQQPPAQSYFARKAVPLTLIGLGVGAAGLGGTVFGLQASGSVEDFRYGRDAAAARQEAKRAGVLFDLSVGLGSAVALTGAAILLLVPDEPAAPGVGIAAAPNGVSVQGVF